MSERISNSCATLLSAEDRKPVVMRAARLLLRVPGFALIGLIRIYQRTLSPALPVLTLGGCVCRFAPTCSHYTVEAVRVHGAFRGLTLALRRLSKCTPLHPGGFDPVPARSLRCVRVEPARAFSPSPTSS